MSFMKLLVVSLFRDGTENMKVKHKFLDVVKETTSYYKIKTTPKGAFLLNNRKQIKKDEVDKIMFCGTPTKTCPECTFSYLSLMALVLIEDDNPDYGLLRYWKKQIKEKALNELRSKNQMLKKMYEEVLAI